jgi:hypothetical protein
MNVGLSVTVCGNCGQDDFHIDLHEPTAEQKATWQTVAPQCPECRTANKEPQHGRKRAATTAVARGRGRGRGRARGR